MSYYVTNDNSFLDIKNAHLRVTSGNVYATGIVTTANVEVGGELTVTGNVVVGDDLTVTGNVVVGDDLTVTGNVAVGDDLTVTGNVVVGDDLTVTGNVAVDTDTLFVDSVNNRVGVGTTSPGAELHVAGTGAIVLPSGTTAQQPTGVTGMIRFNVTMKKLEFYTGTVWSVIGSVNAIGGTVTNVGGYTVHTFTSSATFTVISGGDVEYLVVAGGGSGATPADSDNRGGGGGGAGGMLTGTLTNLIPDSYTITVGASGSQSGTAYYSVGTNGSDSTFSTVSATGGGRGGAGNGTNPNTGGSGGGGGSGAVAGTGAAASPSGQGFAGGNGTTGAGGASGGGGGGAGGAGANFALGVGTVVSGGIGQASSISGSSVTYSKGGWSSPGGGNIPINDRTRSGNTGDGGNSGNAFTTDSNTRPSPGSAGIVIIRYLS